MIKLPKIRKERKSGSYIDDDYTIHFEPTKENKWDAFNINSVLLSILLGISIIILAIGIGYLITFIS